MVEIKGYKTERQIGQGGMANVYLAVQESVERLVALKVMSPVLLVDRSFSERFMREAKIAANLNQNNIVSVYDVGVYQDHHYIAMEYLPGGDLSHRCDGQGVDLATTLRVTREMAGALDYAHSKGFVHRDVKPENILFREDGSSVLTDFGIARAVNSATQMTRTGAVIGTPQYMSPEQARGLELDGRSDLYGLGIVFYEMLTGSVPYKGNDSITVGIKHVTEPVPKLPEHIEYLQPIIERFLAKNTDERYQAGADCVKDLRRFENQLVTGGLSEAVVKKLKQSRPTTISEPGLQSPTPPTSTPAPMAGLSNRQEPRIGSLDNLDQAPKPQPAPQTERSKPKKGKIGLWLMTLILVGGIGVAGWYFKDEITQRFVPQQNDDISRWLADADRARLQGRWFGDSDDYANRIYAKILNTESSNQAARTGLQEVIEHLTLQGGQSVDRGDLDNAKRLQRNATSIDPQHPSVAALAQRILSVEQEADDQRRVAEYLNEAEQFISSSQLMYPEGENALDRFLRVQEIEPQNEAAQQGVRRIEGLLTTEFQNRLSAGDLTAAFRLLEDLSQIAESSTMVNLRGQYQAAVDSNQQQQALLAEQQRQQQQIDDLLAKADAAFRANRLTTPDGDNALYFYDQVLQIEADQQDAVQGRKNVAAKFRGWAYDDMEADDLARAAERLDIARVIDPGSAQQRELEGRLERYRKLNEDSQLSPEDQQEVVNLLANAVAAKDANRLMGPPGESAFDYYKDVLRRDPNNDAAFQGLVELGGVLVTRSREALVAGDLTAAMAFLRDAGQVDPQNADLDTLRIDIAAPLRDSCRQMIADTKLDDAENCLLQADSMEPNHPDLEGLRTNLGIAKEEAGT